VINQLEESAGRSAVTICSNSAKAGLPSRHSTVGAGPAGRGAVTHPGAQAETQVYADL